MQDEIKVSEGYQPTHQFISFVEGSSATAPDPSAYPLQVLEADHNLNHLDGGDPTDGFAPWVTDILVYPSSEYWEGLLDGEKVRPYFDLSISSYNTLRIPSAVHNYNLYVDHAVIYESLSIKGTTSLDGDVTVTGEIEPSSIRIGNFNVDSLGNLEAETIKGEAKTTVNVVEVTDVNFVPQVEDTGSIYHCNANATTTYVSMPPNAPSGTIYTFMNMRAGHVVEITNTLFAKGNIISEQYSAATVHKRLDSWYAFGDLV